MQEVALVDRLDQQRRSPLPVYTRSRDSSLSGPGCPAVGRRGHEQSGDQPSLGRKQRPQPLQRAHFCPAPSAISAKAAAAAAAVRSICSEPCASDGNQASNCEAGA